MKDSKLAVVRLPVRLGADARRVIARPFIPGGPARIRAVIDRVRALSDREVSSMLDDSCADYRQRHKDIRGIFRQNYATAIALARRVARSRARSGACSSAPTSRSEYSLESARSSTRRWSCTRIRTASRAAPSASS